jgi:hypothetical protein
MSMRMWNLASFVLMLVGSAVHAGDEQNRGLWFAAGRSWRAA